jgi:hypothetical protein
MHRTSKTQFLDDTACLQLPNPSDAPRDNPPKDEAPPKDEPPEAKSDQLTTDYQKHNPIPREPLRIRGKAKAIRGPPRRSECAMRTTTARPGPQDFGLTKIAYSVLEVIALVGIARASVYEAINRGDLRITKLGKRSLILSVDLVEFLTALRERRAAISQGFRRGWSGKPNTKTPLTAAEKVAMEMARVKTRSEKLAAAAERKSARAMKAAATRMAKAAAARAARATTPGGVSRRAAASAAPHTSDFASQNYRRSTSDPPVVGRQAGKAP